VRPRAPRAPVAGTERVVETVAPAVDPLAFARLADSVRSLRTWAALLTALSVAALALSIYALTREDDTRGASRERVAALDDRVDRLSGQVQGQSKGGEVTDLQQRLDDKANAADVERLVRVVNQLSARSGQPQGAASAEDVKALDQRLDDLERAVAQLSAGNP
jgi:TolA-binding protein